MAKEEKKKEGKETPRTEEKLNVAVARKGETAVPGVVEEIVGRTGTRGEVTQVNIKVLSGKNISKEMRRNVKGPIRVGDLLTLRETSCQRIIKALISQNSKST